MRCTLCLHEAAGNQSMRSENLKAVKFAIKSVKTNPSFSNPRIKNAVNPLTASLLTSLLSNALCWKTETYCTELTNKHSVSFFVQKNNSTLQVPRNCNGDLFCRKLHKMEKNRPTGLRLQARSCSGSVLQLLMEIQTICSWSNESVAVRGFGSTWNNGFNLERKHQPNENNNTRHLHQLADEAGFRIWKRFKFKFIPLRGGA